MSLSANFSVTHCVPGCFITANDSDIAASLDALVAGGAEMIELVMLKPLSPSGEKGFWLAPQADRPGKWTVLHGRICANAAK
jgi:hypothetical protein